MSSKHRRCDARCHSARCVACRCWCGGIFHGAAGAAARREFVESFGAPIPAESPELAEPLLHWRVAGSRFMEALQRARAVAEQAPS
jgi:hypothetical protein